MGRAGLAGPLNVEPAGPTRGANGLVQFGAVSVKATVVVDDVELGSIEQTHRLVMLGPGWGVLAWRAGDIGSIQFHRTPGDHADRIKGDVVRACAALVRARS